VGLRPCTRPAGPEAARGAVMTRRRSAGERIEGQTCSVVRELTAGSTSVEKTRDEHGRRTCAATRPLRSSASRGWRSKPPSGARRAPSRARAKVTSVDKANVLETSRLWREVVSELHAREFAHIELEHLLVDNAAMQLGAAGGFDVLLTENLFGDILSDEAAMLTGSIGMLPSASLGDRSPPGADRAAPGPVRAGARIAPDICRAGTANPLAMIPSAAMMLRQDFCWSARPPL